MASVSHESRYGGASWHWSGHQKVGWIQQHQSKEEVHKQGRYCNLTHTLNIAPCHLRLAFHLHVLCWFVLHLSKQGNQQREASQVYPCLFWTWCLHNVSSGRCVMIENLTNMDLSINRFIGLGLAGSIFLHPDFGIDKTNKVRG